VTFIDEKHDKENKFMDTATQSFSTVQMILFHNKIAEKADK